MCVCDQICDKWRTCPAENTCCCTFPVGKSCLAWGCCALDSATCCDDHYHCCPHEYPICNLDAGLCLKVQRHSSHSKATSLYHHSFCYLLAANVSILRIPPSVPSFEVCRCLKANCVSRMLCYCRDHTTRRVLR